MPNQLNKLKYILPGLAIILILLILLLLYWFSRAAVDNEVKEQVWQVNVLKVEKKAYAPVLTLYGQVESPTSTKLEAAIEADVKYVYIKEGSKVKKGQTLIELDNEDALIVEKQQQAKLNMIEAEIEQEKLKNESDKNNLERLQNLIDIQQKETNRIETLFKKKVSSESEFDQAKVLLNEFKVRYIDKKLAVKNFENRLKQLNAEKMSAEASLEQARLDLKRTKVIAPYDGVVVKLNVAIGNRVQKGEVLIELFPAENKEVRAQIATSDLPVIKKALRNEQKIEAKTQIDGESIHLVLERLSGTISQGQAGVDAIFVALNNLSFLEQHRVVQLIVNLPKQENLVAIPEQAVYTGDTLYKVVDQRLEPIKVSIIGYWINEEGQHFALVNSKALKNGELILTTHLLNARKGLKVSFK